MAEQDRPYLNRSLPAEQRAADLVARMTLEEKISQMIFTAAAIERLGIPEYSWWGEGLHGVGRSGLATVFPQSIGLAATWDEDLMLRVATAVSDEARAIHQEAARRGYRGHFVSLTYWSPNVNIVRDPRWGRSQETYGEDPYLTGRMGLAFVKGMQGDDPRYLKLVATPKHFAVHSGPEAARHGFDAKVSQRDLRETYLAAFETCVTQGKAASVMGAYNRVNGEPASASKTLLQDILREEWGFTGYVVSDYDSVRDIWRGHHLVETAPEAAALAVKNGCELNIGETFLALADAVAQGLITEAEIDVAVTRLFTARMRLGMFDPEESVPYAQIPYSVVDSPRHRRLALEAARESIVLLKNEADLLPLPTDLKRIAVIGPLAVDHTSLRGNYNGTPSAEAETTILEGIRRKVGKKTTLLYALGTDITGAATHPMSEAVTISRGADVAIVVLGSSPLLEGEEGETFAGFTGDRTSLSLPGKQEELLRQVQATGVKVVLVLLNGSSLAINWADANTPAIVEAWYPGQAGGAAVADVLFGDYNPAGRLPVTFYHSLDDLPPFEDYAMAHRTYRYFSGQPLYPFGYGLSYTEFRYHNLTLSKQQMRAGRPLRLRVEVENVGPRAGDEVVQLYLKAVGAAPPVPRLSLRGFRRVHLAPGKRRTVRFTLSAAQMAFANDQGRRVVEPGEYEIFVGGGQPGARGMEPGGNVLAARVTVTGVT